MSDDTEIDTSGTVHAETSNVDITEHVSRDGDDELCFELTNRDEAVTIQTRFDDDQTRVSALAMLSPDETDALADALGVERDVTVERGRPKRYYNTTMLTGGILLGSVIGYELAAVNDAFPLGGLGVAITIVACALVVSLVDGLIRGDVLGGGL